MRPTYSPSSWVVHGALNLLLGRVPPQGSYLNPARDLNEYMGEKPVRLPRPIPIDNMAWREWIHRVTTSAKESTGASTQAIGACGVCALQSLEIINSILQCSLGDAPLAAPPAPMGELFDLKSGHPIESFKSKNKSKADSLKNQFYKTQEKSTQKSLKENNKETLITLSNELINISDLILPFYERTILLNIGKLDVLYHEMQGTPTGTVALLGYTVSDAKETYAHTLVLLKDRYGVRVFNTNLEDATPRAECRENAAVVFDKSKESLAVFVKDLAHGRFGKGGLAISSGTLIIYGPPAPEAPAKPALAARTGAAPPAQGQGAAHGAGSAPKIEKSGRSFLLL